MISAKWTRHETFRRDHQPLDIHLMVETAALGSSSEQSQRVVINSR